VIRSLLPLDVARYSLLGGQGKSNRAFTLTNLVKETRNGVSFVDTIRLSVALRNKGLCAFSDVKHGRVTGIAAARPRSGNRTWEVTHLLLSPHHDPSASDLIRHIAEDVAQHGGERVFLRLRGDDAAVSELARCGLNISCRELLFKGRRKLGFSRRKVVMRKRKTGDSYKLFRLYNTATPFETRSALGLTFEQWRSSRERVKGRIAECVYEKDDVIRGWVKTIQRMGYGQIQMMVHPEDEVDLLGPILEFALSKLPSSSNVYVLVPEYQVLLASLLRRKAYDEEEDFVSMVRSMAVHVKEEKGLKAVNVARIGPVVDGLERYEPRPVVAAITDEALQNR